MRLSFTQILQTLQMLLTQTEFVTRGPCNNVNLHALLESILHSEITLLEGIIEDK